MVPFPRRVSLVRWIGSQDLLFQAPAQFFGDAGSTPHLLFHVGEFPPRVFEEELAAGDINAGEEIQEQDRRKERDRATVLHPQKMAVRDQELTFLQEPEPDSQ